jgi:hypothetical protein
MTAQKRRAVTATSRGMTGCVRASLLAKRFWDPHTTKRRKKTRNRAIHSCPSPDDEDDDDHNDDKCSPPDPTGAVCREPKRKRERMDLAMAMSLERLTKGDEDTTTLNLTEIHDDEVQGGLQRRPISTKTLTRLDLMRCGLKDVHVPVLA